MMFQPRSITTALILLPVLIGMLFFTTSSTLHAQTDLSASALEGLEKTADEAKLKTPKSGQENLNLIIGGIIKTILGLTGVLFMLTIFGAAELWLTADGNEEKLTKARTMIFNGAIGMIVVFAAYLSTNFLVSALLRVIGAS